MNSKELLFPCRQMDSEKMKTLTLSDTQPIIRTESTPMLLESHNNLHHANSFIKDSNSELQENENRDSTVFSRGKWTDEEHQRLLDGLKMFGNNWMKVSEYIGTRTRAQARSHTQKYFEKVKQEQLHKINSDPELRKRKVFLVTRQYLNRSFLNTKEINEFEVVPVQRKKSRKLSSSKIQESLDKQNSILPPIQQTPTLCPSSNYTQPPFIYNSNPFLLQPSVFKFPCVLPIPPGLVTNFFSQSPMINGNSSYMCMPFS